MVPVGVPRGLLLTLQVIPYSYVDMVTHSDVSARARSRLTFQTVLSRGKERGGGGDRRRRSCPIVVNLRRATDLRPGGSRRPEHHPLAEMDNGEIEISNQEVSSNVNDEDQCPGGCSMESFFDEILKDSHACTHTHTCNPPGPDMSHTHTCFHVHTKIITAPTDGDTGEKVASRKRPLGNREAVRKYREKMKARTASLEDEVSQLREVNEQLLRRLQNQVSLEAEVMRLKCLLVDIRGRIEGEIGSFPYQKPLKNTGDLLSAPSQMNLPIGTHVLNPCDMRFNDQVYCMRQGIQEKSEPAQGGLDGQRYGTCDAGTVQCSADSSSGSEFLNCGVNLVPMACVSSANRKRGRIFDLLFPIFSP